MRPQEARRLIKNAMEPFYRQQHSLYPAFNKFKRKRVITAVSKLLNDFEKADDSPMYYQESLDCVEAILGNMLYISDRWHCTGRLKFLKRVIELY